MRNSLIDHHMKYVWVVFCTISEYLITSSWKLLSQENDQISYEVLHPCYFLVVYHKKIRLKIIRNKEYQANWYQIRKQVTKHGNFRYIINHGINACVRSISQELSIYRYMQIFHDVSGNNRSVEVSFMVTFK